MVRINLPSTKHERDTDSLLFSVSSPDKSSASLMLDRGAYSLHFGCLA
jgi:hypothetical protein